MTRHAYTTLAHRRAAASFTMHIILYNMRRDYPHFKRYSDLSRRFYGRVGRGA